jgi:hypothetical protein
MEPLSYDDLLKPFVNLDATQHDVQDRDDEVAPDRWACPHCGGQRASVVFHDTVRDYAPCSLMRMAVRSAHVMEGIDPLMDFPPHLCLSCHRCNYSESMKTRAHQE